MIQLADGTKLQPSAAKQGSDDNSDTEEQQAKPEPETKPEPEKKTEEPEQPEQPAKQTADEDHGRREPVSAEAPAATSPAAATTTEGTASPVEEAADSGESGHPLFNIPPWSRAARRFNTALAKAKTLRSEVRPSPSARNPATTAMVTVRRASG